MGLLKIVERGGEDYREYKKALRMAKKSIEILCDLTEDMESEYGYGERSMSRRDDDEERVSYRRYR